MPAVLVYHPNAGDGHNFASFGWAGFIGTISGYSSSHMGVCEKVWAGFNGTLSRVGVPWHFLLRDIMQVLHQHRAPYRSWHSVTHVRVI
jgi:hypothetical protein